MTYIAGLLANRPGARASVNEETGEILEWFGPDKQPTTEEMQSWRAVEDTKPLEPTEKEKIELLYEWATTTQGLPPIVKVQIP